MPDRFADRDTAAPMPWSRLAGMLAVLLLGFSLTGCLSPYEKASQFYANGDLGDAKAQATRGLERAPDDPQLNLLMAKVLVSEQNYRQAESYAQVAFESEKT